MGLLFLEASTRTRTSFDLAARALGGETFVLDPGTSSLTKGESFVDTVRTLDALGLEVLVIRHHRAGAPYVAARHFSSSIVNAGDGWHAHPTQALLDLYTLRAALGPDLAGRKVAVIGDLRHSRVARSNAWTLTATGVEVWACAPSPWLAGWERLAGCLPDGSRLHLTDSLEAAVRDADAVMALRIQRERMAAGMAVGDYLERYQVSEQRMTLARPGAHFMHPGPINLGVEVTREVANGPRSLVLEQARNGVPLRMAVLSLLR